MLTATCTTSNFGMVSIPRGSHIRLSWCSRRVSSMVLCSRFPPQALFRVEEFSYLRNDLFKLQKLLHAFVSWDPGS